MALSPKLVFQGTASSSFTNIYVVGEGLRVILKELTLCNTLSDPVSFSMVAVPSGLEVGSDHYIFDNLVLEGKETVVVSLTTVLSTGYVVKASASVGSVVAVLASGVEEVIELGEPVTNADVIDAVAKKHSHANLAILEGVTATYLNRMGGTETAISVVREVSGSVIDWTNGNMVWLSLSLAETVLTFNPPVAGAVLELFIQQDVTGSRTVTWPASVKWVGGAAPTLSTGADAVDLVRFVVVDDVFYGEFFGNFA